MAPLILAGTEDTLEVSFDPTNGKLLIAGTSMPENARKFFDQILAWVADYVTSPCKNTTISFKLNYFNTASTKYLFDIMVLTKQIMKDGNTLVYNWYFDKDDDDMYEAGVGFSKMLRYPFNFVNY